MVTSRVWPEKRENTPDEIRRPGFAMGSVVSDVSMIWEALGTVRRLSTGLGMRPGCASRAGALNRRQETRTTPNPRRGTTANGDMEWEILTNYISSPKTEEVSRIFSNYNLIFPRSLRRAAAAAGGGHQALRHVGQGIAHHGQGGHVLAEILGVHLVQGVGLGVVPVEVVRADGALAQTGNAIAQQRTDVAATAARGDFARADALEQLVDLLQHGQGGGVHAGAESARSLGAAIHFDGRGVVLDFVADKLAVGLAAAP